MIVGFSVAACSGVFAALASVFSKAALEDGGKLVRPALCPWIQDEYCDTVVLLARVILLALMLLSNAFMITLFVRSMQYCSSTAEATVINNAANLLTTATLGQCLFGEVLSLFWWFGASLIIVGMLLIRQGTDSKTLSDREKTK
ncbi:transmembrane protein 42-like [Dysidea avara]|uniref:transmembrane protein 42-like n=1 Tax=Dysidea avara TaxID=196820 RepID=UPI003330171A